MTLYDVMMTTTFNQIFCIYVVNVYGQYVKVGVGTRYELMQKEDVDDCFEHLMNEIELLEVLDDGTLFVEIKDKHFNERLEIQYDPSYVAKWDRYNPATRPYRTSTEIESYRHTIYGKRKVEE